MRAPPRGDVSERELFDGGPEGQTLPQQPAWPKEANPPRPAPQPPPRVAHLPAAVRRALTAVAAPTTRGYRNRALAAAFATELDRGTPFLFMPVLLGAGAIIYFRLPSEPDFQPLFGGVALMAALAALVPARRQAVRLLLIAVLVCLSGMALAKLETWRAGTGMLGGEISTRLTARVAAIEQMANGRVRLTMDVLATARPTLRYAPQRVRLTARRVPPGTIVGSQLEGVVTLMPPSGPVRPDSYDFSFTSYFDGIGASGFFLRGPDLVEGAPQPSLRMRLANGLENVRNDIATRIRGHIGGPEGEIAAALVVGIRAGIPEDINEAMRRTGIYHIISISGLHMALVAGTVMSALRVAFAAFPGFASRRPVKKYAAGAALAAIAGYLFLSGGDVAAQRSFLMLAVMLIALLFDRGALTTRNLAISALVIMAVSPHEVVGPSFQMSFAATAALVSAYAIWAERRHVRKRAPPAQPKSLMGRGIAKAIGAVGALAITSVVAGVATTAFGVYHFQRVSPLSLLANLAVMPSVSILVMPFAVAGSLAMPLGLDAPFFYVMGKGLSLMIAVSIWISDRSPIDAVGLISAHSLVLLTVALVFACMATTWLRLLAVPAVLAGVLTLTDVRTPDVFISEDGRLLAVPLGSGKLAVNRARPNAFTSENWKRAVRAEELVGPVDATSKRSASKGGSRNALKPSSQATVTDREISGAEVEGEGIALPKIRTQPPMPPKAETGQDEAPSSGFHCHDGLCVAVHPAGAIVVHAASPTVARRACNHAAVIVVDDATAKNICPRDKPLIITKRDLAKFGSAVVYLGGGEVGSQGAAVHYAVGEPYRPWHAHRQFSREARGWALYVKKSEANSAQPRGSSQNAGTLPPHDTED